mmetsp:Transcript_11289/g.42135  ORF Transcript_11289/g.42135 Transcript_11289/m.42135 type:complete len:627 (-) Transcript_11289:60-1940(-)
MPAHEVRTVAVSGDREKVSRTVHQELAQLLVVEVLFGLHGHARRFQKLDDALAFGHGLDEPGLVAVLHLHVDGPVRVRLARVATAGDAGHGPGAVLERLRHVRKSVVDHAHDGGPVLLGAERGREVRRGLPQRVRLRRDEGDVHAEILGKLSHNLDAVLLVDVLRDVLVAGLGPRLEDHVPVQVVARRRHGQVGAHVAGADDDDRVLGRSRGLAPALAPGSAAASAGPPAAVDHGGEGASGDAVGADAAAGGGGSAVLLQAQEGAGRRVLLLRGGEGAPHEAAFLDGPDAVRERLAEVEGVVLVDALGDHLVQLVVDALHHALEEGGQVLGEVHEAHGAEVGLLQIGQVVAGPVHHHGGIAVREGAQLVRRGVLARHDVREAQGSAGLEHAIDLLEQGRLVLGVADDFLGPDAVEALRPLLGQAVGVEVALASVEVVLDAQSRRLLLGQLVLQRAEVEARDFAAKAPDIGVRRAAMARAQVQQLLAGAQPPLQLHLQQGAHDVHDVLRLLRDALVFTERQPIVDPAVAAAHDGLVELDGGRRVVLHLDLLGQLAARRLASAAPGGGAARGLRDIQAASAQHGGGGRMAPAGAVKCGRCGLRDGRKGGGGLRRAGRTGIGAEFGVAA